MQKKLGIAKSDTFHIMSSIKKTFFWMFLSRMVMFFIFALAGIFAIEWIFSEGAGEDPFEWVVSVVLLYVLWAIITIMAKYKPKEKLKEQNIEEIIENR